MYIDNVHLENIRCCKDLQLFFDGKPSSILLCGDNGDGKSTVLRSIAMGLCDESSAAALLRDLPGDFVRDGEEKALISIILRNKNARYRIETTIESLKTFEKVSQKIFKLSGKKKKKLDSEQFSWEDIFVSAYGAGIRTNGTADYQDYVAVDAVYPLYKYDIPLQNPELAFRRIIDDSRRRGKYVKGKESWAKDMHRYLIKLLKDALDLKTKDQVFLSPTGLEVKSSRWGLIELGALGDGYKAITTCILDMLSWWMLYLKLHKKSVYKNRNIEGIVLIDEIEQHLHPRWQLKVIELLRRVFPKIQFIFTTHSPLVISSYEGTSICQLRQGEVTVRKAYGWLPGDVYLEIMGLSSLRPKPVRENMERFEKLHIKKIRKKISNEEEAELRELRRLMRSYRGHDANAVMIEINNLAKELKKIRKHKKK